MAKIGTNTRTIDKAQAAQLAEELKTSSSYFGQPVELHASSLDQALLLLDAASAKGIPIKAADINGLVVTGDQLRGYGEKHHGRSPPRSSAEPKRSTTTASQPSADAHKPRKAMQELQGLIGLGAVKTQIETMVAQVKVNMLRRKQGLKCARTSRHMIFKGPPGTGKTTVARLVGEIYREAGVVRKGHLKEASRADLVAQYVGHTAKQVDEVVDEALDGVLFIDEAYSLVPENGGRDFGHEAVATLIQRIENDRDRLVVILAGYEDEMERLMDTNPGLRSRFRTEISFSDYSAGELMQIFERLCRTEGYVLTTEAVTPARELFAEMWQRRGKRFGNGRAVRNAFDNCVDRHALRLSRLSRPPTKDMLMRLEPDDIPEYDELAG